MKLRIILLTFVITLFLALNIISINGEYSLPKTIKIGLSFGSSALNNFNIKSPYGIIIQDSNGKLIASDNSPDGFIFNTADSYHIQIGGIYDDIETALSVRNSLNTNLKSTFIAYENGWKIWTECLNDENQSLEKINKIRELVKDFELTLIKPIEKRITISESKTGEIKYIVNAEKDILIKPNEVNTGIKYLEFNNKKYRGFFILKRLSDNNITIINDVTFEEYLYGVVPSESPSTWPMEALKAQAVAARNFAAINIGKHSKYGFDLCNTQDCQVYKGLSQEVDSTNQAVNQTINKMIYYDDKPINAFYHSSSGGHTENSENIFSSPLPYITGVDDKYSLGNKNDSWIKSFDKEYIKNKMIDSKLDVGDILDIIPIETTEFGRVTKVEIRGTKSSEILQKEKIRYVLGTTDLKSIWYNLKTDSDINVFDTIKGKLEITRISGMYVASASGVRNINAIDSIKISNGYRTEEYNKIPNNYTFYGKGFGHGLGMSQYGAKGMAEAGFDYKQILEHYYKGAIVR